MDQYPDLGLDTILDGPPKDELDATLEEWYAAFTTGNNQWFFNACDKLATKLEQARGFGRDTYRCPLCHREECSH